MLQKYESVDGGWGYYDFRYQTKQPSSSSISFTNSTALVALKAAQEIGINVPERLTKEHLMQQRDNKSLTFLMRMGSISKCAP